MIKNVTSHDITDCANQQLIIQAMHEENKITCADDDNTEETHNSLSWFIQFAIYELRYNSQMFRII